MRFTNQITSNRLSFHCRHIGLALILFILFSPQLASGQFSQIFEANPQIVGQFSSLTGSHFVSPSTGYICHSSGVAFTSDSGRSQQFNRIWLSNLNLSRYPGENINLTTPMSLKAIYAVSADMVVAVGDLNFNAAIAVSTNRGQNWLLTYWHSAISDGLTDVSFSGQTGFAVGSGYLLRTTNGGINWQQLPNPNGQPLKQVICFGNQSVWAVTQAGQLYRSADNGASFALVTQAPALIADIAFVNPNFGFAAASGQLFRTTNTGLTWQQLTTDDTRPGNFAGLRFASETVGFTNGHISTDSGRHWEELPNGPDRGYSFVAPSFVWATDGIYKLYKSNTLAFQGIPNARFRIDSTALASANQLRLISTSDRRYQHRWFRNGQLLANSFEVDYQRDSCTVTDTFRLEVSNNAGSRSHEVQISYRLQQPIISSFLPTSSVAGGTVTITGTNLHMTRSVSFAGVPARSFSILSSTTITAIVDTGRSGAVQISSRCGISSRPGFTFIPPSGMAILRIYPDSGRIGDEILIEGSKLNLAKRVLIGGAEAQRFSILDSTKILAVVGKGQTGLVEIRSVSDASTLGTFTFVQRQAPPKIISISPTKGLVGSLVTVKLEGLSNTNSLRARFGSFPANIVNANTDSITIEVPPGTLVRTIALQTESGVIHAPTPFETIFNGGGAKALGTTFQKPAQFSNLVPRGKSSLGFYEQFYLPVLVDDLDGDGQADMVATPAPNSGHGLWAMKLQMKNGIIEEVQKLQLAGNTGSLFAALGDLNNDGLPEIVVSDSAGLLVYTNLSTRGDIKFGSPVKLVSKLVADGSLSIHIMDFDNDGFNDIQVGVSIIRNLSANSNVIKLSEVPYIINEIASLYPDYPRNYPPVVVCRSLSNPYKGKASLLFGLPGQRQDNRMVFLTNESEPGILKLVRQIDHPILLDAPAETWESNIKRIPFIEDIDRDGIPDLLLSGFNNWGIPFGLDYYKGYFNQNKWEFMVDPIKILMKDSYDQPSAFSVSIFGDAISKMVDLDGDGAKEVYFGNLQSTPIVLRFEKDSLGMIYAKQEELHLNSHRFNYRTDFFYFDGLDDLNGDAKPDLVGRTRSYYFSAVPENYEVNDYQSIAVSLNNLGNENVIPICPAETDIILESPLSGSQYLWQVDTGTGYIAAKDLIGIENANTKLLTVKLISSSWRKAVFRCLVNNVPGSAFSMRFENSYLHNDTATLSYAHWHNPNVWSCGVVPNEYTHVVIPAGSAADIKEGDASAKSITIKNGSSLIIRQGRRLITQQ
ncbi:MAG: IPT/TIG domain-containing protein [Chitinophagaceae bacterium]|nr:IPT/TIG domain-containing protein [Chitinophagaceae bacterium]